MGEMSKQFACGAYEVVDKLAKDAWERLKKAHKKKANQALEEAIKDFSEAMEQVYDIWPAVVEELGIDMDNTATEIAYLGGYSEAKRYGMPDDLRVKRGDHVATRTRYKVSRK